MSESATSHQLRLLRTLRLVRPRRAGRMVFYALDDRHIVTLFKQGLRHVEESRGGAAAPAAGVTTAQAAAACTKCAVHVESVFRVTGMCCAEEVAILERRLTPLAGVDALSADVLGQKLHVSYDAARARRRRASSTRWPRPACARGSSTRRRSKHRSSDRDARRLAVAGAASPSAPG